MLRPCQRVPGTIPRRDSKLDLNVHVAHFPSTSARVVRCSTADFSPGGVRCAWPRAALIPRSSKDVGERSQHFPNEASVHVPHPGLCLAIPSLIGAWPGCSNALSEARNAFPFPRMVISE